MFDTGSALVKPYMRDILREIGAALGDVENRIALAGHTDATPYGSGERGYSNWELSADRANASRRELVAGGLPDDKLRRVEGLASSRLLRADLPTDPVNRRISIVVMTQEAEERMLPPLAPAPTPAPLPSPTAVPAATAPATPAGPASAVPAALVPVASPAALQISGEVTKSPSAPNFLAPAL